MRAWTDTRRGRRDADGQRLANRQPQKKMSGTSKVKGKASFGVGKKRDEMKKADHDWANNPRWKGISRSYSLRDRKSTRLNSSHSQISYAVFCLKKKKKISENYQNVSDLCVVLILSHLPDNT